MNMVENVKKKSAAGCDFDTKTCLKKDRPKKKLDWTDEKA